MRPGPTRCFVEAEGRDGLLEQLRDALTDLALLEAAAPGAGFTFAGGAAAVAGPVPAAAAGSAAVGAAPSEEAGVWKAQASELRAALEEAAAELVELEELREAAAAQDISQSSLLMNTLTPREEKLQRLYARVCAENDKLRTQLQQAQQV
jgi:hypothetical protein